MLGSSCAMEAYGRSSTTRQETETMSFLAWIALGLVAGFIGSKIVNRRGEGIFLDVLLGIVGAITGGWLFRIFGAPGVSGLNLYSLVVAVVGSVVFLVIYHAIRPRRAF
jgi:uncharacterized membrane protein YeaQ/YmgE (transglycosylase-associated protein family)